MVFVFTQAVDDGDMSLRKGEVIHQIDQVEGGWWTGVGSDGSKRGLFPCRLPSYLHC